MTRRIEAKGPSLEDALIQAVAEAAGCEPEEVSVSLSAPGFDSGIDTRLKLEFRLDDEEPAPAARQEREERQERSDGDDEDEDEEIDLDAEADAAADFLEGLLDAMELPGDLKIRIRDDHAEVELIDVGSGALIGRRGQTLEAIQELVRCSMQRQFQRRSHVKVDIEGYRARRLEKLLEKAEDAIDDVLDSGEPERLEPMDVFERKAVHHLVAEVDGVTSRSQGREPARRVVIEPS
jgi:spoIIIJ-associated protein